MAKKTKDADQPVLIDVEPENAKQIKRIARAYKRAQVARLEAGAEEKKQKAKLLEVVREANIQAEDGVYEFRVGDIMITVEPRDELVKVKFDDDESQEDSEE